MHDDHGRLSRLKHHADTGLYFIPNNDNQELEKSKVIIQDWSYTQYPDRQVEGLMLKDGRVFERQVESKSDGRVFVGEWVQRIKP